MTRDFEYVSYSDADRIAILENRAAELERRLLAALPDQGGPGWRNVALPPSTAFPSTAFPSTVPPNAVSHIDSPPNSDAPAAYSPGDGPDEKPTSVRYAYEVDAYGGDAGDYDGPDDDGPDGEPDGGSPG